MTFGDFRMFSTDLEVFALSVCCFEVIQDFISSALQQKLRARFGFELGFHNELFNAKFDGPLKLLLQY